MGRQIVPLCPTSYRPPIGTLIVVTVAAVLGQGTTPSTGELETSTGNDNTGVSHAYLPHCCTSLY